MDSDFESIKVSSNQPGGSEERRAVERQMIGQFRIEKMLGAGGMSVVYKCTDLAVNRPVAVKVLQKHLAFEERWLMRFRTEAMAIGRLSHPNIVRVHHFDAQDDEPFIVMDFVDGIALSDSIAFGGALTLQRSVKLMSAVMDALANAHANGVVHRDLKPSNIMIVDANTPEESVRILDFGIAKIAEEESNYKLTQTGEVFGSPQYMSPEQCAGRPAFERPDQYSVGCVLFECLTGHPPFVGDSAINIMVQHMNDVAPTLKQASLGKNFSPHLESLVKKLLQKNPEQRFASMCEAKAALEATLNKDIASTSVLKLNIKSDKGRNLAIVCATVFGGSVLIVLVWFFLQAMLGADKPAEKFVEPEAIVSTTFDGDYGDKGLADYLASDDHNFSPELDTGIHGFKLMTDKSMVLIAKMPNLGHLTMTNCGNITAAGFKYLWDSPRLDNLDVGGIFMSDEKLRNIGKIKTLVVLKIAGCSTHASSLAELADSHLQSLNVSHNNVNEDGCRAIAKILTLQDLNIGQNRRAGPGLKYIATLPKLDTLHASSAGISDENLIEAPNMPDMKVLNLSNNFIDDDAVPKLLQMRRLEELNISSTHITDKGFLQLSKLPNLRSIKAVNCKFSLADVSEFHKSAPDCDVTLHEEKQ